MHSTKTRVWAFGAACLVGLTTFGSARSAHASSDFPAALQKALQAQPQFAGTTFCVPLCTACHNTTQGGPQNINPFGHNLEFYGGLALGNADADAKVLGAVTRYFMATPAAGVPQVGGKWDSDNDGVSDEQELKDLSSPSLARPRGEHEFCSDLAYGCGARIAPAPPPVDRIGLFSASFVILGLAAFRRFRRVPAS